jgi:hypothetical protein
MKKANNADIKTTAVNPAIAGVLPVRLRAGTGSASPRVAFMIALTPASIPPA